MGNNRIRQIALGSAFLPAFYASSSFAQQSPASVSDIVVTATRREQNIQKVPVSVTALSELAIKSQNIADTRDMARLVPAVVYIGGGTTKIYNFSVRGIGTYVFSDALDQSVGVAFDGVPLARSGGSIADLIDIERVEVLEGPQGMLFGKNASAGLINIITRKPELGKRSMDGRLSFGNYDELQAQTTVNLPIGDNFALRASAWKFRHDGFVDNVTTGKQIGRKNSWGGRLRARWQPADGTDINLTGEWTGADQDPQISTLRLLVTDTLGVKSWETAKGTPVGPANRTTTSPTDLFNKQANSAYTLQIDQDVMDHTLSSVTSYREIHINENFDPVATNAPLYTGTQGDEVRYKQFSQELRITSPASQRLRYVIGGIYFKLNLHDRYFSTLTGATPVPANIVTFSDIQSEHYAAFAEFTFDLFDKFRLIAGGRASHDKVSGDLNRVLGAPPIAIVPAVNGPGAAFGPFTYSTQVSAHEPSWRFGMQYDLAPDVMLYATVSRGYKAPGLDYQFTTGAAAAAATGLIVKPEIAKNYEIGIRSQLFDRKLTLNLTAFHEQFTGFQTAVRLPTNAPLFATQNANEILSDGIEGTFTLRPGGGITLSGAGAYIHARYTDFKKAACYPREPVAPVGTPLTPGICVGGVQTLDGWPLANSPRFSGNLTARYDGQLSRGNSFFLQANYRYQSKIVFNAVADPLEKQGGYGVLNLGAGIRFADDAIGVSLYGKNVLQQDFVYKSTQQLSGAYYSQTLAYDAQRTYGVALDFRF